jgi:predicted transcriptional regulator
MPSQRANTSFRLTAQARTLLTSLAKHLGLSRTAVLEYLIRREARRARIGATKETR